MSKKFDAVVAGHLCVDVIPNLSGSWATEFKRHFLPGRLLELGPVSFCTGGPVSNTGLTLNRLGLNIRLMGKVGDDLLGQAVNQIVAAYGPHLTGGMVVDPTVDTSYTLVFNPPGVDRILLHCPGANDTFSAGDVRYPLLHQARLFHFGYPPLMKLMYENGGTELTQIFRRAKKTGITTSLDMALPDPSSAAGRANWPAILTAALPDVDIFLPSIEEILYMLRRETYNQLCRAANGPNFLPLITPPLLSDLSRELLEMGPGIVGLKLGDRGLYLRTAGLSRLEALGRARPSDPATWANKELWSPCFQVKMVGTVGSGDATIAGFLAAFLRNLPPEKAVTAAVAVGACNVEAADALSGIRPWAETMTRISNGWPKHRLALNTPDWRFNEQSQIFQKISKET